MWAPRIFAVLCLLMLACGDGVIRRVDAPPPLPVGHGILRLKVSPPDATIFVDGKFAGVANRYRAGQMPIELGRRRIRITRAGFYDWYGIVSIARQQTPLEIELVKGIDADRAPPSTRPK